MGQPRAVTLPCARCGRAGGPAYGRHTTPQRLDGRPFGFDGKLCASCWGTVRRSAAAKVQPSRRDRRVLRVQLEDLAEAVLAFRDVLAGESTQEQTAALAAMVRLAESVEREDG